MLLEIHVAIPLGMLSMFHKVYIADMVITTNAFVGNTCTQAKRRGNAITAMQGGYNGHP